MAVDDTRRQGIISSGTTLPEYSSLSTKRVNVMVTKMHQVEPIDLAW